VVRGCCVRVRLCPAGTGRLRLVPANTRRGFTGLLVSAKGILDELPVDPVPAVYEPGQPINITARITRTHVVHGLISEYVNGG